MIKFKTKFRRNSHEEYWKITGGVSLYEVKDLVEDLLKKTEVGRLEVIFEITERKNE